MNNIAGKQIQHFFIVDDQKQENNEPWVFYFLLNYINLNLINHCQGLICELTDFWKCVLVYVLIGMVTVIGLD